MLQVKDLKTYFKGSLGTGEAKNEPDREIQRQSYDPDNSPSALSQHELIEHLNKFKRELEERVVDVT